MRRIVLFTVLAIMLTGAVVVAPGSDRLTLRTAPPVVVRTEPPAGAAHVDPGLEEIRVTFSKKMKRDGWSFVQADPDGCPTPGAGEVHFLDDGRTCVFPVRLDPGRTYALWINSETYRNFQDRHGRPAVPYLLVFRTARYPARRGGGRPGD